MIVAVGGVWTLASGMETISSNIAFFNIIWYCRGHLLGHSFVSSECGRGPLQDEDHSGSRPHSFPGLYLMRCGRAPEWFRSGPGVAGSWESRRDVLVCGFPFYWTLWHSFCDPSLNFLRILSYVVFLRSGNIQVLCQVAPRMLLTVFLF